MGCTHCIPKGGEHNPLCAVGRTERAYAKGRVDERAAIVTWLRDDGSFMSMLFATLRAHDRDLLALTIERGDHEKEKP